jgi:hypothetical protein
VRLVVDRRHLVRGRVSSKLLQTSHDSYACRTRRSTHGARHTLELPRLEGPTCRLRWAAVKDEGASLAASARGRRCARVASCNGMRRSRRRQR